MNGKKVKSNSVASRTTAIGSIREEVVTVSNETIRLQGLLSGIYSYRYIKRIFNEVVHMSSLVGLGKREQVMKRREPIIRSENGLRYFIGSLQQRGK